MGARKLGKSPRNLLRLPRNLHFKVHKELHDICTSRSTRYCTCHEIYTSRSTKYCACHEFYTSRSTKPARNLHAPATQGPQKNTTPATKPALQGPQSTAPATMSALQCPQIVAPATKAALQGHEALRLPQNTHFKVHKVLYLPPNLKTRHMVTHVHRKKRFIAPATKSEHAEDHHHVQSTAPATKLVDLLRLSRKVDLSTKTRGFPCACHEK